MGSKIFKANFKTTCPVCNRIIMKGSKACYNDDRQVVHFNCVNKEPEKVSETIPESQASKVIEQPTTNVQPKFDFNSDKSTLVVYGPNPHSKLNKILSEKSEEDIRRMFLNQELEIFPDSNEVNYPIFPQFCKAKPYSCLYCESAGDREKGIPPICQYAKGLKQSSDFKLLQDYCEWTDKQKEKQTKPEHFLR